MTVDPRYSGEHYASLSDDALREIARADPVETDHGPDWMDEGAEVYSIYSHPGITGAPEADRFREVLEAAGIPCFLEPCGEEPEDDPDGRLVYRWRVVVPGELNLRATGVLERDIFNDEFETVWRNYLEMLSEKDLRETRPQDVFCGLFDKVERVIAAYRDEFARRGL